MDISNLKNSNLIKCCCKNCNIFFYRKVRDIKSTLRRTGELSLNSFCSKQCSGKSRNKKVTGKCTQCGKEILKFRDQVYSKYKKTNNIFCNSSCSATYNNQHKTYGVRVSKIEKWLQSQLLIIYPHIQFLFNDRTTIKSELDIYVPEKQIAFEINGIFHYKPIYGSFLLERTQQNDLRKQTKCKEKGIKLIIIDISKDKKFTESEGKKHLTKIIKEINARDRVELSKNSFAESCLAV
jgi:hypothetical protein